MSAPEPSEWVPGKGGLELDYDALANANKAPLAASSSRFLASLAFLALILGFRFVFPRSCALISAKLRLN